MKIKVEKEELQRVLQGIQGIVERRNTMPILNHCLFMVSGQKTWVLATDLEIALKEPVKAEVIKEGGLCVPARKLFEITKEVEDGITLEAQENNWLKVKAGLSAFKLIGLPEEEYPQLPKTDNVERIEVQSEVLKKMIEKTIYAAGDSDTRYTLNGLLLHFIPVKDETELRIVGTDGHRLSVIARMINAKVSGEKKLILPKKAAQELRRLLEEIEGMLTIGIEKNHLFFQLDEVLFTSRLIEGTYPNYEQVIPKLGDKKLGIDRGLLIKAIRRTAIMSREKSNAVRMDVEDGKITMVSSNPDIGEAKDEVAVEYKGEAVSIGFNARYLLDALLAAEGEKVTLEMHDALSPTMLKDEADEGYKNVIMPMRI